MPLSSDDILNQKFPITKFRDGYDLDQVDDFLDLVAEELRGYEQREAEHKNRIAELEQELAEARTAAEQAPEAAEEAVTPEPVPVLAGPDAGATDDAVKSSAMLQLALELHDKHVNEGKTMRDEMLAEGEKAAKELVGEAEKQRSDVLQDLNSRRLELQNRINELRDFEDEYRTTLRSYIEAQLRNLDTSQEPSATPESMQ